jgi:E3 ubiquitin-protein ligase RNF139
MSGWQTFIKRRTAVAKINSLPDAKTEDLATLDDVCAICYQEMTSAKITRCRHFFHGVSYNVVIKNFGGKAKTVPKLRYD